MLDLLKIIKDNRKFKIILKNSLMNKEILEQILHTENYQIDLDEDNSSEDNNINVVSRPMDLD